MNYIYCKRSSFNWISIKSEIIWQSNNGVLGKPVVVWHGPCLQGLGSVSVHQGTAPVVFPVVPCVSYVYNVITGHTQRRRVTAWLDVEIDTHIEGVSTREIKWRELGAELGVCWVQGERERETTSSLFYWDEHHTPRFKNHKGFLLFMNIYKADSPSGLLWCLSVKGSVHHWREKWATSAVHWLSNTLPPPNKTRSSWATGKMCQTAHIPASFLSYILCHTYCMHTEVALTEAHVLCEAWVHTCTYTPPAVHCPLSIHTVQLESQLSHGWQRSPFCFLQLL